jgi:hypothetical protein
MNLKPRHYGLLYIDTTHGVDIADEDNYIMVDYYLEDIGVIYEITRKVGLLTYLKKIEIRFPSLD